MFIHIYAAKINNKFKKKNKTKILYLKNKESSKENDNRIKIHLLSENNEEGTSRN